MSIDYSTLKDSPRLLLEAKLKPLQGERFQPTGFADLGHAVYTLHNGTQKLLVESAQSVANRMEITIWDEANDKLIEELEGLPYIQVTSGGQNLTNSILEAHRLNSAYILPKGDGAFRRLITEEVSNFDVGPFDLRKLAKAVFKYDPNAVLHGVFLEKIAGRLRLTRAVSGFIEATNVRIAESGGVKFDRVNPGDSGTAEGRGNVPFHRTEFTADDVRAFFNLDLALIRGYRLGDDAENLLITLGLLKIRRFLNSGLRLRSACDLDLDGDIQTKRPSSGFEIPTEPDLLAEAKRLVEKCQSAFAAPSITQIEYVQKKEKPTKVSEDDNDAIAEEDSE